MAEGEEENSDKWKEFYTYTQIKHRQVVKRDFGMVFECTEQNKEASRISVHGWGSGRVLGGINTERGDGNCEKGVRAVKGVCTNQWVRVGRWRLVAVLIRCGGYGRRAWGGLKGVKQKPPTMLAGMM